MAGVSRGKCGVFLAVRVRPPSSLSGGLSVPSPLLFAYAWQPGKAARVLRNGLVRARDRAKCIERSRFSFSHAPLLQKPPISFFPFFFSFQPHEVEKTRYFLSRTSAPGLTMGDFNNQSTLPFCAARNNWLNTGWQPARSEKLFSLFYDPGSRNLLKNVDFLFRLVFFS